MKLFHIIANPTAGKNKQNKILRKVEAVFKKLGAAFRTYVSKEKNGCTQIAQELTSEGATDIVVLGGDGTLHEVLNGIQDPSKCNLGLIPAGTGNDFAEHLGLSKNPEEAAKHIINGTPTPIDYLQVGDKRCMNVCGVGMDVDVLERCSKGKRTGKMKYFMSLLQSLFAFKGQRVEIESEGVSETRDVLLAAACNGSQFGGGIRICPNANSADGKIEAVIVDCIGGKLKIIQAFLKLLKGKILEYPASKHFVCDRLKFIPATPCPVQLDGELYYDIDFDVRLGKGLHFYK